MKTIRLLTEDEKESLKDLYGKEFNSTLPLSASSKIIGLYEDEKLIGHVMVELVARVGLLYVEKEVRGKRVARELLEYAAQSIPTHFQVMVIASEERFEKICERFGMQKLEGTVYVANL